MRDEKHSDSDSEMGHSATSSDESRLPVPVVSKRKGKTHRLGEAFVAIGTLLALWQASSAWIAIARNPLPPAHHHQVNQGELSAVEGYWNAIAGKGMRGVTSFDHGDKKHKHKHESHPHHGHGHHHDDKHGHHPGPIISPWKAEEIFLSVPTNDSVRAASRRYTATAHPAGSGFDFITALQVKNDWESLLGLPLTGIDEVLYDAGSPESQDRIRNPHQKIGAWIDTYYPVMNTPVSASVTLLTDPPFHAKLQEDIVEEDGDSILRDEVKTFHGLSVSGDVTGQVVYAAYGRKSDFDLLQSKGIDFTGKIALVKYGGVFRGLKIKAAQEAGAIGCLIYSDPGDDGEFTEANGYEQYPLGPARQPSSVQRGSVQFISKYPGDPSTPGEPAYPNATRSEGGNQPSIPSLPISYQDALPILKALQGHGIAAGDLGKDWAGGLGYKGIEYFTGPSEVELHFVNEVNTRVMPIWNTMAMIPGYIHDEVVIIGNHRDAWVLGGADPNSGTASVYDVVKGLGKLLKSGWKPLRTIILASWDAEEYGLIGSTEWAEDFGDWLKASNAAYLNMDSSVSGSKFAAEASPSLAWLIRNTANEVEASHKSSASVWDTHTDGGDWKDFRLSELTPSHPEFQFDEISIEEEGTGVRPMGSGSDYTAFLQRYGVASLSVGYSAGPKDPVYHYHSIYDSFYWQDKFADPGFHKHADMAKIFGLLTLRLADGLILPLNTTQYASELEYYLSKIEVIASSLSLSESLNLTSLGSSIDNLNTASKDLDSAKITVLKKLHDLPPRHPHPHGHTSLLHRLRAALGMRKFYSPTRPLEDHRPHVPCNKKVGEIKKVLEEIRSINRKLQGFESGFISEEGIKEREWYKHKGVAPGIWLGYGATTFPALTEALTIDHSVELAQKEADELAEMIHAMAKRLKA